MLLEQNHLLVRKLVILSGVTRHLSEMAIRMRQQIAPQKPLSQMQLRRRLRITRPELNRFRNLPPMNKFLQAGILEPMVLEQTLRPVLRNKRNPDRRCLSQRLRQHQVQ